MPDIEDVLADAQREIKAIGDNVKSLKDTTDKSLADVRKLVEDAPKSLAGSDSSRRTSRRWLPASSRSTMR